MKKTLCLGLTIVALAFSFISCAGKPSIPKAGSARAEDMLTLIPKASTGVIVVNLQKAMNTAFAQKAITENENYKKYQEFVQATGIDPQKDVYFMAVSLAGDLTRPGANAEGSAVINMRFKKDLLEAKIKEKLGDILSADYNGFKIFQYTDPSYQNASAGAFLDDSNIVVGSESGVKATIDVFLKKAENVLANKDMMALIDSTNKAALVWCAFTVPQEATDKLAENPFLSSLKGIKSLVLSFDYKNKSIIAEIAASGLDEAKNKQLAETLSGFKSLASAGVAKDPKIGELLNKIEISSTAASVRIFASIPEELLQELSKKVNLQKALGEKKEEMY